MAGLAVEKHVKYILSVEKRKDDFMSVVMEHLRLNGSYWGLTTLEILGKIDVVDAHEVFSWIMACQHESDLVWEAPIHVQVLALFDKIDILHIDKVTNYITKLQNEDGSFSGDVG